MNNPIKHWRNQNASYLLEGMQCAACSKVFYPNVFVCSCNSRQLTPLRLSGRGIILSFTKIEVPATDFVAYAPYYIALIALAEGPAIVGQLTDINPDLVAIGAPVRAVFRKLCTADAAGSIYYGTKFVLDL